MRKFYILIALTIGFGSAVAQSANDDVFYFDVLNDKMDESVISPLTEIDHIFGEEIGKKMEILRESYTWIQEGTPLNPSTTTNVEKPAIYNAVKKLERYYKKGVKKGVIDIAQAQRDMNRILDIAIYIRHQATSEFENFLDEMKTEEQLVSLFTEKVSLN